MHRAAKRPLSSRLILKMSTCGKPCYKAILEWRGHGRLTFMQVTLTRHGEELLKEQLARGIGLSPEEIVERALETLAGKEPSAPARKTPAEAVAHIRKSRKGVTLGGLSIKDLIHEGHKY